MNTEYQDKVLESLVENFLRRANFASRDKRVFKQLIYAVHQDGQLTAWKKSNAQAKKLDTTD